MQFQIIIFTIFTITIFIRNQIHCLNIFNSLSKLESNPLFKLLTVNVIFIIKIGMSAKFLIVWKKIFDETSNVRYEDTRQKQKLY